jgi:protein-disulfide isomerase
VRLVPLLQQVLDAYPKDVKLVVKNFPLSQHKYALKAALAALAANRQGKFWEFHDNLVKNAQSLDDRKIQSIAKELNLNMQEFNKDMNDVALRKILGRERQEGEDTGLKEVPWILVNGKHLKDHSFQSFKKMIQAELKM